jgi:hypothetical protein
VRQSGRLNPHHSLLPKNLRHAVSQLSDGELDGLCEAAFDEAKRRGGLPRIVRTELSPLGLRSSKLATKRLSPTEKRRHRDIDEVALTRGQVNAVPDGTVLLEWQNQNPVVSQFEI